MNPNSGHFLILIALPCRLICSSEIIVPKSRHKHGYYWFGEHIYLTAYLYLKVYFGFRHLWNHNIYFTVTRIFPTVPIYILPVDTHSYTYIYISSQLLNTKTWIIIIFLLKRDWCKYGVCMSLRLDLQKYGSCRIWVSRRNICPWTSNLNRNMAFS